MAIPDPNNKPKTVISATSTVKPPTVSTVPDPNKKPATGTVESHQAWINNSASGYGGMDNYAKNQNQRWQEANKTGNADLMSRLQADSKTRGYVLDPYQPTAVKSTVPTEFADWQSKQNDLMSKFESMLNQPFNYDPNTDPAYQAQRQLAQLRAGDASKAAMETMNEKGVFGSTMMGSQLGQIQQRAEQEAAAYIPEYRNQAYGQHQDRLRGTADMLNFASGRSDRAEDTAYRDDRAARGDMESDRNFNYQQTRDQRNDYESDRLFDYGVYRDNVGDEQWAKQFQQSVKAQAEQMGYNWSSLNQRERQMVADQAARQEDKAYSQMQDKFSMGLQTFQQTGQMPDYMSAFGVNVEGLKNQETQAEVLGLMNDLATGAVQPEAALKMIEQAEKAGIKTGVVSTQLKNTVYDMFPEYSPESKEDQQKKTDRNQKLISDFTGIANYVPSVNVTKKAFDWLTDWWKNYGG